MRATLQKGGLLVLVWAIAASGVRAVDVPFKGVFNGMAVSAVPVAPDVLLVTTVGGGNATQLGRFTMVSPHLSNLVTLEADGTQNFTAADGDTLTASFAGQFHMSGGFLTASLNCTITGGTGRFEGAGGSYRFDVVFDPATLTDQSVIDGTITLPAGE